MRIRIHNTVAFYELCYLVAGESSMVTGSPGQEDDDPRHGPNIYKEKQALNVVFTIVEFIA
jgi:hypothetical protein